MVFESIVADLLNKYLGQYVKNLDASQLKIGIWGGNVVLENLELKDTALDDLDLPIKVVRGYLGKLVLAIPWKNLYHEATIIEIDDLHIVSKPNFDIKYNKEKEEKEEFEKKKRQIEKIEEARRLEEQKKKEKSEDKEDQDTFVEKLATNIIKNLQVTIKNIHVRYEDSISEPTAPFAVGVTLGSLTAQTTDGDFVPQVIKESVTIINKLLKLEHLALYWNSERVFDHDKKEEWLEFSRSQIATSLHQPKAIKYILKPIVASKKLKINTKPGLDMNIPKIFFSLIMEDLGLILFRSQYHGLMKLLESFERMSRNAPFRKYRPFISPKQNVQAWWNYCITSVLEENVKRRFKMWSWEHIKAHRTLCKAYKKKYLQKLDQKNPSKSLLGDLEKMENDLNIVSITIFRQLAESEFVRDKKTKQEKSFFSFFGPKKKETIEQKTSSKLEELMGLDKEKEMAKLYEAIGYSENEVITAFPPNYIAMVFKFQLKSISITLKDDTEKRDIEVVRFSLNGIHSNIQQRPSANALRVCAQMQSMKLYGTPTAQEVPLMIRNISKKFDDESNMVDMLFETNPLEKENIDQMLTLDCQPLEIIYDANSINKAISFFEPPQDVILQDLQNKAYSTFEEFKVSSTAGILHAIEKRKILDVNINIDASYLIIPENGVKAGCKDMAVIDFGSFHLKSDPSQIRNINPKDIDNICEVQEKAYDRFHLKLNDLQLLLCREGEDFHSARQDSSSIHHVLYPLSFEGNIAKSIIPNDPRLKQITICGELSSIELSVSDNKISRAVKLIDSLPKPKEITTETNSPVELKTTSSYTKLSVSTDNIIGIPISPSKLTEDDESDTLYHTPPDSSILSLNEPGADPQFSSGIANQVMIEVNFVVQKIKLSVSLTDKITQKEKECVEMYIHNISAEVLLRRWDMFVNATVGQFTLREMTWGKQGQPLELFYTPKDANMLKLSYRRCEFDQSLTLGPSYFYSQEAQLRALQYRDEFQSTQQIIDVKIAMLFAVIHQEALLSLATLITQVLEPLQKTDSTIPTSSLKKNLSSAGSRFNLAMEESFKSKVVINKEIENAKEELKKKIGMQEELKLRVTAYMDGLDVLVCSSKVDLAHLTMKGFSAGVLMQDSKTEIKASMSNLLVVDQVGQSNFSKILYMQSQQVFAVEIIVFNNATVGADLFNMSSVDLSVKLDVGQIRAVFLNRFVMDIFSFLDNFESAKVAILEAGMAAKDKAAIAVSQFQKHSSRNQLIVTIKAPLVIVPVHSLSELALIIDLGELRIYNNFRLLNKEKRPKDYVIVDNMVFKLSELKISKALIKEGINITAQRALIEPMTLKLNLARSLTKENHSVPDIDLQGSLKTITLVISEEDISVAFKIVQGNIAEGQVEVQKNQNGQSEANSKPKITISQNPQDRLADINEDPEDNSIVYDKTVFKFDLEKVILQLYLKPPDMTFEEEFLERDIALMLSQFTIGHFCVSGKMLSNDSMSFSFILETLQLDDKRPSSTISLTRMMDCCSDALVGRNHVSPTASLEKTMLEASYEQSSKGDKNMSINVNNLMTILNVEFLMVVMQTILAIIPKSDTEYAEVPESPTHSIVSSDEDNVSLMSDVLEPVNEKPVNNSEVRFHLKVNNPQVVLLADARDLKTNALFFTTAIYFQYFEIFNVKKMMASISNTEVFSAAFKKEYRTDTSSVLFLEVINFQSSTPLGCKPQMHVHTSVIKLSISPKTISTLSACASQTVMPESLESMREKQKIMSKLWAINDVSEKKLWYLNTLPQHILSAGSFVLARTENGNYSNGFLAKKDTHFMVYFYPEGSIIHSVTDSTSVIVDMPPKESDLLIGGNVLAIHSDGHGWQTGRIVGIWKGETEVAEEVAEDALEEWSPLHENKDTLNKYLIRFYCDCTEKYYHCEELRTLPCVLRAGSAGIGACVYARFKDGFYYKGLVKRIKDNKLHVSLEEINDVVDHDVDDPSAVILNINPQEGQVKKLFKVIASKSESTKGYHPGKVAAIKGNRGFLSYFIEFEDGSTNQVPLTKLLLMPKAPYDALPTLGTYVYSRVARDSPLYEKGIVADLDDKLIYIKHLNGRKISHDRQNTEFVVRNIIPVSSSLRIGQDVIAQVDSDDLRMYFAEISDIVESPKSKRFIIKFTDGSTKKLTLGKIRLVPKLGMSDVEDKLLPSEVVSKREHLIVDVEGICLRVEGYLGGQLTPMMRFNLKLQADVFDWTDNLNAISSLSMHASYYNESVAEWEPLIEPVSENQKERPWQLNLQYITQKDDIQDETALLLKPMAVLKAESFDCLELTLTKASISLFQDLGKVFSDAYECVDDVAKPASISKDPFVIQNKTGKKVTVELNEFIQNYDGSKVILLHNSAPVGFEEVKIRKSAERKIKLPIISVQVDGYHLIKNIVVKQQRTVIYDLVPTDILSSTGAYSIVVEVMTNDGQRSIFIRSALQIKNHFPMPLDIFYKNKDNESILLGKIESKCVYSVPLIPAYHSSFYLKPSGFGYNATTTPLLWSDFVAERKKVFICVNPEDEAFPFYIQVVAEEETYTSIHGMLDAVPKYLINCHPPFTLHNYLPYTIKYKAPGMPQMENLFGGNSWPLFTASTEERSVVYIEISDYFTKTWTGGFVVSGVAEGSKTSTFSLNSEHDDKLELKVYAVNDGGVHVTLYSPYWMLNKTGKTLVYQAIGNSATFVHPADKEEALMFYVKGKKSKKARICVEGCEWSDEFSLDTVNSGGALKSEGLRKRMFEIGVGISLSYFGLTKIVTFTPLRVLTNHTKFVISMAESGSETSEWHTVNPDESVPYWPTCLPPENLFLNINGISSVNFNPLPGQTLLLKFQNEIGGICVNYQEKDSSSLLSFKSYFSGSAPVRIENLCKKISMISYKQSGYFKGHVLLYGQSVLYTWDDPTLPQELTCGLIEVSESQTNIKLDMNDFGRMKAAGGGAIYWVTFLDGLQRVLLFTDNFKSAYCANQEQTLRATQEINVHLEGIGLSLVNSEKRLEIGYLSIRKSCVIWEKRKNSRWKSMTHQMCEALEEGYLKFQNRGSKREKILEVEVDFEKMFITKPEKIKIRRTFHSGFGFKYIISPNRMQVSATLSSLQFDSHIPGSTFMTIIHQVEPPKSVASDSAPKPFFELSLTANVGDKNEVHEVSYLKVLIQEMDVRVDKGLLLSIMDLLSNDRIRGSESVRYNYDMSVVNQKLEESPEFQAAKRDKRYVFNFFHLSPLKIHVSFSMTGGHSIEGSDSTIAHGHVLNLLLQSVGVAFTEIQDVEFKLACFEVNSCLLSSSQLTDSILKHYQTQAVKQLYILVLGLDVLGNPYGLITGVGAGAKNFFYEPYQGLIQGPEEFAEGLAYGVKSLVGGTVGGVSGAVSKITGTVGKGLAALTMDDEYQQKRRQRMSQRPTNLGQGLAEGGKGLVKGIFSGVTGIVVKPYEGAKAEGATGFIKGIGKGLVGVVARPVGGVVDMASSTFDGLKSTTSGVKRISHNRVARVFHADKVLRAFNEYEAEGNKILTEVDKGRYSKTDFYMAHIYPVDVKSYLILTNKSIIVVNRNDLLHEWESSWKLSFSEIKDDPVVEGNKITFNLTIPLHRKSVFKKTVNARVITLQTDAVAKWFVSKFEDAKML